MTDEKQGRATPPVPDDEHAAFVTWWDSPTRDVSEDQSARRGAWAGWRASALATRAAPPEPPADALTAEQRREIADALPKVGESENVWTSIRGSTLRALASQREQVAPPLSDEQREDILDEMRNTHGFIGEDVEEIVNLVIDATLAAQPSPAAQSEPESAS